MKRASVRMSRALLMVLAAAALFATESAGANTAQDEKSAQDLERYLAGLSTLQAEFHQRSTVSGGDEAQEASGRLYLQKPGRFRWDYRQPSPQLIISDGVNLWLYDEELEQVTVKSLDDSLAATPALLLAGKANVGESFTVTDAGSQAGLDWVRLTPKRADTDFVDFRLGFADGELKAMELKDKLQQTTRIEFSDVKRNARLAGDLFKFSPPAGVDVIGTPRH